MYTSHVNLHKNVQEKSEFELKKFNLMEMNEPNQNKTKHTHTANVQSEIQCLSVLVSFVCSRFLSLSLDSIEQYFWLCQV